MNHKTTITTRASLMALVIILVSLVSEGQKHYTQNGAANISVAGTSTIHEWAMASKNAIYDAVFETNAQGEPVKLTSLIISVAAESMKSGKGAMDKNAYSALKTDKNKQITFQLTSAKMDGKTIQCTGKLTVAGTTKQIEVETVYTLLPGNSLQCKGSKKILMTDFNVEPPSFMLGSVTTGNEITISFEVVLASRDLKSVTSN